MTRILIVDDEKEVRDVLARMLKGAGFEVLKAASGEQALQLADTTRVDLVITDLWMPGMNGVEVLQELEKRRLGVEVVVLSGHVTEATRQKMDSLGAFAVLTKPFGFSELLSTVREAMKSDRTARTLIAGIKADEPEKPRVLVADDEPEFRHVVSRALERAGYEVEDAADGAEACEKMLASDFALVLMDINMPRMGGIEAIKEASRVCPGAFFVVITGEATAEETQEAISAGAYKCLRKPIDLHELVAELPKLELIAAQRRRALERRKAREEFLKAHPQWRKVADGLHSRRGRRMRPAATTVLAVLIAAVMGAAVPLIIRGVSSAALAAGQKMRRYGSVVDRIEGYLERDEQRELEHGTR